MEGNARYVSGASKRPQFLAERDALIGGQNPYAGVLSCADSRIVPEFAFDSARGDLRTGVDGPSAAIRAVRRPDRRRQSGIPSF